LQRTILPPNERRRPTHLADEKNTDSDRVHGPGRHVKPLERNELARSRGGMNTLSAHSSGSVRRFRGGWITLLAISFLGLPSCDDDVITNDPSNVAGRWVYQATELTGPDVTCTTSDVVLTLVRAPGSIRLDSRFDGSAFAFTMECRSDDRTATLLFTEGASVVNGEVDEGVVAFDFEAPDFIHTGSIIQDSMGGTVATRLDLTQSSLSDVGVVNLIGEWTAVRD
jgi:hypothetical protein